MSRYSARGPKWQRIRAQVLAANSVCWLCGRPGANEVDHVVPASVRPDLRFDPANLRPAHSTCNRRRGAKPATTALGASRAW